MLKQVPGGPTKAEARQFSQPPVGSGVSFKYATVNAPSEMQTNEYPIVPYAPDSYDTLAQIKSTVGSDENKQFGGKWMVPFTDNDAQYMLRQQAQAQNANYERWLWKQYNLTDPAQAWIFQQIAPEQFEKRKQLILYQQNLATKYALLRLYGVKNQEDLMLKYLVETNQVELPKGPIWDPAKWMAAQGGYVSEEEYRAKGDSDWVKRYSSGFFSPMRWVNQDQVGKTPTHHQDPLSFGIAPIEYQNFAGKGVPTLPYKHYGTDYLNEVTYDNTTFGVGKN